MENDTQWLVDEIQCPEADHEGYQLNQSFEFWMEGVAQTIVAILGKSEKKLKSQNSKTLLKSFWAYYNYLF